MKGSRRHHWTSEAELAAVVTAWLDQMGYETYAEVAEGRGAGRRADIVAVRGPITMIVETKTTLSLSLLEQCARWLGAANYVIACCPFTRNSWAASDYARLRGFGLWLVSGVYGEDVSSARVDEVRAPRLWRHIHAPVRRLLRPEHRRHAPSGSAGGGYYTPFRATCDRLRELVRRHPGVTLKDAMNQIEHHYVSIQSARSCLPGRIREGLVPGVVIKEDGRRLLLFPEEKVG